jgi:hypothetical protein
LISKLTCVFSDELHAAMMASKMRKHNFFMI